MATWTVADEALLAKWMRSALGYRYMHKYAARYFDVLHRVVKIPGIVLSTAVTTTLFADGGDRTAVLAAGLGSLAAAVLAALDEYLELPARAANHRTLAAHASHLLADISAQLSLPAGRRMTPDGFVEKCFEGYDELLQASVDMPCVAVEAFRRHVAAHGLVGEEEAAASTAGAAAERV